MARILVLVLVIATAGIASAQGTKADYERAASLDKRTTGLVFRESVTPHWLPGGESFWYEVKLSGGQKEIILVDAAKGERRVIAEPPKPDQPAPDREPRPSRADSSVDTELRFINRSGQEVRLFWIDPGGRRRSYGTVPHGESRAQHTFAGHRWRVEGVDGTSLGDFEGADTPTDAVIDPARPGQKPAPAPAPRPERVWTGFLREHNVWIRNHQTSEEVQLSRDGTADDPYREPFHWSPDGMKLHIRQVRPPEVRRVHLIESSPRDRLQPKLDDYEYAKPGDRIAHPRPRLFDIATRTSIPIDDALFPNPWALDESHWAPDSSRFYFVYNQRGHQVRRLISVDAATGAARAIVDEQSPTFIDYSQKTFLRWLDDTGELIWMSERDGHNHLYLIDALAGTVKAQVTRGEWNVRSVDHIDSEKRQAWVRVVGVRPHEDPYHFHLARVGFDGSEFRLLTNGDGTHRWDWSPDRRFFVDTWSRADHPPVIELRRGDDGGLVCELERADITALRATGWPGPERFVAPGRDSRTAIHGLIFRPMSLEPGKMYPVIEQIYAGPQDFHVPKSWSRFLRQQSLAELGFFVVQIDGMGTNWRSKAFHDVCWKNLKDAGFPDRIAWMRAAAAKHPAMDLSRVGVFGGSAGGQNALGAVLFHGDFYRAAAADCGCHDNRMDKIWWNEAWMGWPIGPEYADNSNVTHAARLNGHLLLTVGELDRNVDPASTMQVVNALIKADKDFELVVFPGSGHGAGGSPYGRRRRDDFFVRHLWASEPRAAAGPAAAGR